MVGSPRPKGITEERGAPAPSAGAVDGGVSLHVSNEETSLSGIYPNKPSVSFSTSTSSDGERGTDYSTPSLRSDTRCASEVSDAQSKTPGSPSTTIVANSASSKSSDIQPCQLTTKSAYSNDPSAPSSADGGSGAYQFYCISSRYLCCTRPADSSYTPFPRRFCGFSGATDRRLLLGRVCQVSWDYLYHLPAHHHREHPGTEVGQGSSGLHHCDDNGGESGQESHPSTNESAHGGWGGRRQSSLVLLRMWSFI